MILSAVVVYTTENQIVGKHYSGEGKLCLSDDLSMRMRFISYHKALSHNLAHLRHLYEYFWKCPK